MAPNYRSLVPGGFFSSTPYDRSMRASVRCNNPGAINGAFWETHYPGFVDTVETTPGNKTTIFETPEYGIAVWWELLRRYRAQGHTTVGQIINTYGGGQDYTNYINFVTDRTGFASTLEIGLGDDNALLQFGKAMFRYEAGEPIPWSDAQILYGVKLGRADGLIEDVDSSPEQGGSQSRVSAPRPMAELAVTASPFAAHIVEIANAEWRFFGGQTYDLNGHATQVGHKEGEDGYYQRIGQYWVDGTNTHGIDGRNHDSPWSAAFISWVMKTGGAGDKFRYSTQHSVYIYQAIRDRQNSRATAGFWGWRLNEYKPKIGDLVCWARQTGIDYDNQSGGIYAGHCDIVVAVDALQIEVIGGNVGDSVTRRPLRLSSAGFLLPADTGETLFALMENRVS